MSTYLTNALPLGACPERCSLRVSPATAREAAAAWAVAGTIGPVTNAIGHPTTSELVVRQLKAEGAGYMAPGERVTLELELGDTLIVAQYIGPRLAEGATELPGDARIEYRMVEIKGESKPLPLMSAEDRARQVDRRPGPAHAKASFVDPAGNVARRDLD